MTDAPETTTYRTDYHFDGPPEAALTAFARMDQYQDESRPFASSQEAKGYWVFTDHDVIVDGLQRPDLWSSAVVRPTEPDPPYRWLPIMLDPPEHTVWRQLLSSYFSPRWIKVMEPEQRRFAVELITGIRDEGRCDFVSQVGHVYPTTIFLQIMGMPTADLPMLMTWEEKILRTLNEEDPDGSIRGAAMGSVTGYFAELIAARRANPVEGADDVVSAAVGWRIDGEPVGDAEILNCMLLLFLAGLDTVAGQFSYAMLHLATHDADRKRIVESPDLIRNAAEELLRAYPIVQTARQATRDGDFHGCPVKAGDVAAFPLAAAGRDISVIADARRVDLDRDVSRNYAFGTGPHRCLGSHLARQEMVVLLEEWHRLIPDYALAAEPTEHTGGVFGLNELQLRWEVVAPDD